MPLNLSNRDQNSGHLFYNRRLRAAITRFSVRMKHDDRKQQAAVALSIVLVVIGVGWMALLHVMKPAGLVGAVGHHRQPRHRRGLREDQWAPLPRAESDLRAAGGRQRRRPDLGHGKRDRQVPDRSDDRHSRRAGQLADHVERRFGVVGLRHRGRPGQRDGRRGHHYRRPALAGRSGCGDGPDAGNPGDPQGRDLS